jgi:hypothetical protein
VPGNSHRTREIDVLLESDVAGYPVRIAVECKNEKTPIGSKPIDESIGKLDDLGIPRQQGIYVSASGYRRTAIDRAQKAEIRLLKMEGLTKDRLSAAVVEAFQSIVYLLEVIREISIVNSIDRQLTPVEFHTLYNSDGQWSGMPADLIWECWYHGGKPDSTLGEHQLQLEVPQGWHQIVDGQRVAILSMTAKVHVVGSVVTLPGNAEHLSLVDASNAALERTLINTSFDTSRPQYPVTMLRTEEDLEAFTQRSCGLHVAIGRFRLPRIHAGPCYRPPSERTAQKLGALMHAFMAGKVPDPRPIDIREIEGTDMGVLWEPILQE